MSHVTLNRALGTGITENAPKSVSRSNSHLLFVTYRWTRVSRRIAYYVRIAALLLL